MSEFYNESIKNRYLDSIENDGSRHVIHYIFIASKITEEILEKDLYNFSDEEVFLVMKNISPKSYNGARSNINYIRAYISWAITTGYRENNINPLDAVDRKVYSKFVDRNLKIHYSDEELDDLIEEFDNAQDQAMVQLWFEGVQGREFSEIKNLNYYDINWITNELELKDYDGSKRKIKISNKCMRYLENAHKQQIFRFYYEVDKMRESPLFQSNFIFRNVFHFRTKEEGVSTGVIYNRLNAIKKKFDLEYFTPNGIKQSGMIYMASEVFKRDGKLEKEQLHEIGERFNYSRVNDSEGKGYPNVTLMKEFITSENLKELYDIDVDINIRQRTKK